MLKDVDFCHLGKYKKRLLDTRLDSLKTAFIKHEFIANKIAVKVIKQKYVMDENPKNVEVIITPPDKREKIVKELTLLRMEEKGSTYQFSSGNFYKRKN